MTRLRIATVGLAALLLSVPAPAAEQLLDGIAAQVGTRIVLISEVLRAIGPQETMMREGGAPEQEIAKLRADALEQLIEARLIEGVVAQLEFYAQDEEIEETIRAIAEENGLTLEQLYASVVFHGMTRQEYREQIRGDLERRKVINGLVGQDVQVDDRDLQALYDERFGDMPDSAIHVHVRQILVSHGQNTTRDVETACNMIDDARQRVLAGESFIEIAKEMSEVAPSQGGDIGWLQVDQLASWMSEAIDGLEEGGISEPLLLPFGCSVLQVVERRSVERMDLEKARPMLFQELWNAGLEEAYREWMEELRGKTYIDRRGYFADAANFGEATFPVEANPTAGP